MNRTLLSLAIIQTNWIHLRKDYIENFVPLMASLIKKKEYEEIALESVDNISKDFADEYGLILPSSPILSILNRLSKNKLISRENGKFVPNYEKLKDIDITKKSSQIIREFENVIKSIQEFITKKHNFDFSKSQIEEGLVSYLKSYDLDLLFAAENYSLLPEVRSSQKIFYLINEFIATSLRSEPDIFKFIFNLTIGHALSATILYKEFNSFSGNLTGLNIYLDTPFIFNLIGIRGEYKKKFAVEIVNIINKKKANLYILEITKGEIDTNIEEALNQFDKGITDGKKGGLTYKCCLDNNISAVDLEKIFIDLPDILLGYNIKTASIPNYDDFRIHQIDEAKLYDTIVEVYDNLKTVILRDDTYDITFLLKRERLDQKILTKSNSKKEEDYDKKGGQGKNKDKLLSYETKLSNTIYRDVKVLSGIYRFRLGNKPRTLKDCKYLFLTTNSSLAFASRKFEKIEFSCKQTLPTCLTDVFLGTLMWLQSPAEMVNINQKKIIADCYAAMTPSDQLVAKYLEEIEKLRKNQELSEDQYYMLRTHNTAIHMLEEKTLGDPNEFTAQTAPEIMDELIEEIKKKEIKKLMNEVDEHQKTKRKLDIEIKEHGETKKKLTETLSHAEKRTQIIKKNIHNRSSKKSKILVNALILFINTILVLTVLIQLFDIIVQDVMPTYISVLAWIIFAFSGLFNITVKSNVKALKDKLLNVFYKYYFKKFNENYKSFITSYN
ncbi:MAG: hypothetical protein ACFFDN_25750 [Candidatus Hodarchaeota archaeon]